jgi:hypothetical protein
MLPPQALPPGVANFLSDRLAIRQSTVLASSAMSRRNATMGQTLHLEYQCTEAEMKEARELQLRKQVGGGSKWRTRAILLLTLVAMLLGGYFKLRREVAPANRPYVIAGFVVLCTFIYLVRKRLFKRGGLVPIRLEVSGTGFTIQASGSNVTMPWTAFSECLESPELFVLVDRPKTAILTIPKRAFPTESWLAWFREQSDNRSRLMEPAPSESPIAHADVPADSLRIRFRLGFRDYADRTMASMLLWGFLLFLLTMMLGVFVVAAANPPPDAVYSSTQMFFFFVLPFFGLMIAFVMLVGSVHTWLTNRKFSVPQDVALSENSIVFSGGDASGNVPWTAYRHYKETAWSFILWNPGNPAWTVFPKRAFESPDDVQRCRDLLARHLIRSRWFFG